MPNNPLDLRNRRFGRLVALDVVGKVGKANLWLCRCDCGNLHKVKAHYLNKGISRSCGCLAIDLSRSRKKHGLRNHPLYSRWVSIKSRCKDISIPRYGGRNIQVEEPWNSDFLSFYNDLTEMYPNLDELLDLGYQIDRIDNDGNYCKKNVRLVTPKVNARNKSTNRIITVQGKRMCLAEAAEVASISSSAIVRRINKGYSEDEAVLLGNMDYSSVVKYNGKWISRSDLGKIASKSRKSSVKNLEGQVFGRLTVKEYLYPNNRKRSVWLCLCECGNYKCVQGDYLTSGDTQSCGCLRKEINKLTRGFKKYREKHERAHNFKDLSGLHIGELQIINLAVAGTGLDSEWFACCDLGHTLMYKRSYLRSKKPKCRECSRNKVK